MSGAAMRSDPLKLVLASASPRRLALLAQLGLAPDVVEAADVDEGPERGELPVPYARRMAAGKADAVAGRYPDCIVLAADTVVACGRRILPKAEDAAVARRCLRLLSGRRHRVIGGLCIVAPNDRRITRVVTTTVAVKRLSEQEIADYLACGEWHGKAGGYAIQGRAAALVSWIGGSYSNVVGLPLFETWAVLQGLGYGR